MTHGKIDWIKLKKVTKETLLDMIKGLLFLAALVLPIVAVWTTQNLLWLSIYIVVAFVFRILERYNNDDDDHN